MKAYGLNWPFDDPIDVELDAIRRGGKWQIQGRWFGEGLFHHYKALQSLMWPWKKWDRWSELILENLLKNRMTVLVGPANATKTHSVACFILSRYIAFPRNNCNLVSSTDSRSLELRIWGEIKKLWNEANLRYPETPGRIVESKQMIVTDSDEEKATDYRNGIIGVPCLVGGNFVGLGRFVGIKSGAVFLAADECFPAGSMVETVFGRRQIQTIKPGDVVKTAAGWNRVVATRRSFSRELVTVNSRDGRQVRCTPNHPFLTQKGWVKACELGQEHYMLSAYESLQILQSRNPRQKQRRNEEEFLQQLLLREMDARSARNHGGTKRQTFSCLEENARRAARVEEETSRGNAGHEPNAKGRGQRKTASDLEGYGMEAFSAWRERKWANEGRTITAGRIPGIKKQFSGEDRDARWKRLSDALQNRHRISRNQTGHRSGRRIPQFDHSPISRFEENRVPDTGDWVDFVEVQKQEDSNRDGSRSGGSEVFNLQVEGHPSYCVNGFVVHNCQFMSPAFSDAISNMNKNSGFKCAALGNPKDRTDVLGRLSEPADEFGGWEGYSPTGKTMVWKTKFVGGVCIQLDGRDTPNNEAKDGETWPYPHLINSENIQTDIAYYGEDSVQVSMMDFGIFPRDAQARRVITSAMVERFRAQEEPIWSHEELTELFAFDAAYGAVGGDRCVGVELAFGKCSDGVVRLAFVGQPVIIPVKADAVDDDGKPIMPEDQIVMWVQQFCENPNRRKPIPLSHVGFDSTGRGSLVHAFGRLWGSDFHAIEFGGKPTERPVSAKIRTPCSLYYFNMVSELWFNTATLIVSDQCRAMPSSVKEEGMMRAWEPVKDKKIMVEPKNSTTGKPGCKQRMGKSPDIYDGFVCGVEVAQRLGFTLGQGGQAATNHTPRWLAELLNQRETHRVSHQLKTR